MSRHIEEPTDPGMDHAHYAFRAAPDAPPIRWPNGARIAFFALLHLEAWEITPPKDAVKDSRFVAEFPAFHPDLRAWSQREYGNRVGIFRVLSVLDRFGIVPAVALSSAAARQYPELVEECRKRGSEFLAHGSFATRLLTSRMSEADERAVIAESRDAVAEATGTVPRGWVSQDQSESTRTPALLAEAGFDHLLDWPNDDRPYLMGPYQTTQGGRTLVSLPPQPEWDDVAMQWLKRMPPARWADSAASAFAALSAEGATSGTLFQLSLHPWLAGQAHRIRHLADLLARILGQPGTWRAPPSAIAAAFRAQP
jgi:peptidoglycan/xylan/chitin deacetylase (PgdA/CDA1 family)